MDDTKRIISKNILDAVADAIRDKKKTDSPYTPANFAREIDSITSVDDLEYGYYYYIDNYGSGNNIVNKLSLESGHVYACDGASLSDCNFSIGGVYSYQENSGSPSISEIAYNLSEGDIYYYTGSGLTNLGSISDGELYFFERSSDYSKKEIELPTSSGSYTTFTDSVGNTYKITLVTEE